MTATVLSFEEAVAARRPRRVIGELCVRNGLVIADIGKREFTPEEAEHYGRMLVYLAESARRGEDP